MNFKIVNIIFYICIKYIVFYIVLMIKDGNYKLLDFGSLKTGGDWFYHLWVVLFMPVLSLLVMTVPLYYSFKIKNLFYFISVLIFIFFIEYVLYTYFASQANYINGLINLIIGVCFLFMLFAKSMPLKN